MIRATTMAIFTTVTTTAMIIPSVVALTVDAPVANSAPPAPPTAAANGAAENIQSGV